MVRGIALSCALVLASCSSSGRALDADAGPPSSTDALAAVSRTPWAHAIASPRALEATPNGWRFAGDVAGELPARADAPVVLHVRGVTVRLAMLDQKGTGRTDRGVVVYGDGVVWSPIREGVEELRVIAAPTARYEARYAIETDADEVRVRDGRIEILSGGRLVLGTPAVEAIGSDGARRTLASTVTREGAGIRLTISGSLEGLAAPVVVDPLWTTVGSLAIARDPGVIATLSDGRVLAAGGYISSSAQTSTAEIFDPASNTWSSAGTAKFSDPSALVELPSKKVFVMAGGLAAAEAPQLWDPTSKSFADIPGAPLTTDGRAVRVGSNVIVFDTWSGTHKFTEPSTFAAGTTMPTPRRNYALAVLADGRVLVAGGNDQSNGKVVSTAEIYDPTANTWTVAPPMPVRRSRPEAYRFASGKVLVVGGDSQGFCCQSSTELFDPTAGTWTMGPDVPVGNEFPSIAPTGTKIYISGNDNGADAIYDPIANAMLRITAPSVLRADTRVSPLSGNRVLLAGGRDMTGNVVALTTIYTPGANGTACSSSFAGDCASAICADSVCCDRACTGNCEACNGATTAGTCTGITGAPRVANACAPYASCAAGACASSCTADADCVTGDWCKAGKCTPKTTDGKSCTSAAECSSGNCVDAVCCKSTCGGQCEACDVSGDGTCVPIAGAPRGTRPACAAGDPQCGLVCDGVHTLACSYLPAGSQPCGSNACSSGVETHASTCDGLGACSDKPKDCGAYGCGATSCKSACSTKLDCKAGYICVSNACVPAPGLGASCTDPSACSTGFCVDGVCCGTASCGAGSTCAAPGHEGDCIKKNGVACSADTECASAHCVDGFCCESGCDGNCEACDVAGQHGKCTPVRGAPRGKRPACPTGSSACEARLCDGTDTKSCAAYVGGDVSCRAPTCKDGHATSPASCDGKGGCPAVETRECGVFRCDTKGEQCLLVCGRDEDCVDGYGCVGGICVARGGTCSDDGLSAKRADGVLAPCSPFRCKGGACATTCGTSEDCAPGWVCDGNACVAPPPADSGGGCSTSGARGAGSVWWSFLVVASVVALRRRAGWLAVLALGCRGQTATQDVDAGVTGAVESDVDRAMAPLHLHIDHGANVVRRDDAFALVREQVEAELPTRASGALRLVRPEARDAWLSVSLEGDDVVGTTGASSVVYRSSARATDLALVAVDGGVEDVRVLRSADAPTSFTYAITHGPGIARIAKRGRRVVALAADGAVRFSMAPPYAVDANGERRFLAVEVAGDRVSLSLDAHDLRYPIVVDPLWTVSPISKWNYREDPLFGQLPGGDLVIAGNKYQSERLSTATGTWTELPDDTAYEDSVQWAELSPGKFLLYGGLRWDGFSTAETLLAYVWTPGADATPTGSSNYKRTYSMNVLLGAPLNGVLVAGGSNSVGTALSTSEVYLPASGTWTTTSPLNVARGAAAIAKLPGGKALIVGGTNAPTSPTPVFSSAEVFDPTTKKWTLTNPMKMPRYQPLAVVLSTGKVLVAGGGASSAELYDPVTGTWSAAGTLANEHTSGMGGPLGGDRVVIYGGSYGISIAEVWDPTTSTWLRASDAPADRRSATAISTGAGKITFGGGWSNIDGYEDTLYTFAQLANGAVCGRDGDCQSLHCADGVCCNTACTGACQSCSLATSKGACTGVSGAPVHGSCAPYLSCASGACVTSCASSSDCTTGSYCGGGKCLVEKANGVACAAAGACTSGNCVDGVCCDSACDGQCESCSETASKGTCLAVSGAPHGSRPACTGGSGACAATCDGTRRKACSLPSSTTSCGTDACSAGVETHKRTCDGVGHCNDVPKACGAFACGGTTCKTTCAVNGDCAAGFVCSGSTCIPAPGLGETCSASKPCSGTLSCTDGFCCGVASCGAGKSCGLPATRGTCAKIDGETCASDGECGSGACVDSVCCESRCDGQCQACDVMGSVGKCAPVKGAPHGTRPVCPAGASLCEASACDGSDGSACAALAGTDVVCRTPKCEGATLHGAAHCDGKGVCPATTDTSCVPFACDATGTACAASCTTAAECAPGYLCVSGKCEGPKAKCSDDGRSVVDGEGRSASCAPFVCRDGKCLSSCAKSDDCEPGTLCDSGSCVAAPAPAAVTDDGGGCAFEGPRGRSGVTAFVFLLAALGFTRRRPTTRQSKR
ncbi:MAG: kelch repeat-containing protein [Polyangiales bacterium]